MFFLKKLVSGFLLLTPAALVLLGVGLGLLWFSRRARAGKILATCGFGLLVLGTSDIFVDAVIGPLETRYPTLYPAAVLDAAIAQAGARPHFILVLGAGETVDPRVPPNDQLNDAALSRLVEAVRLLRALPGTKLLLSGGIGGKEKHADRLGAVATILGVKPDEMELDRTAWDTEAEAAQLAARIGRAPFLLVTSAVHMPRAVGLFRHAGANPIAAPTQHLTLDAPGFNPLELFPAPMPLRELDAGWHEYLGIFWSKLRGRI